MSVDPERAERILERAEYVEECILKLVERQDVELQEYADRSDLKDLVERRFETMTQACIDIARMLIRDLEASQPDTSADAMDELARIGVLDEETAANMQDACSFRNVLAHQYGFIIDDERVYRALQDLQRYRDFVVEVRDFLEDEGSL